MIYGYIQNDKVYYLFTVKNGEWVSGNRQCLFINGLNDKDGLFTAQEVISEKGLKEIIVPSDFNGRYSDYNFVEQDGKIILTTLKAEIKAERQKQADIRRVGELKRLLADTDYKVIKCAEAQILGLDMPYDIENLQANRQAWREEINELEAKYAD